MKTVRCITCLIGLAVFVGLENPRAYAQAEVDPDHYETRDPEPLPQANTNAPSPVDKIHYAGNFVLPYRLQCNRSSLPPGKYSIAVESEGGTVNVTVSRKGHSTKIEVITEEKTSESQAQHIGCGTQRIEPPAFGDPSSTVGPSFQPYFGF